MKIIPSISPAFYHLENYLYLLKQRQEIFFFLTTPNVNMHNFIGYENWFYRYPFGC